MTTPHPLTPQLAQMPALAELFRLFLSGKHLNRMAEPALWVRLPLETGVHSLIIKRQICAAPPASVVRTASG